MFKSCQNLFFCNRLLRIINSIAHLLYGHIKTTCVVGLLRRKKLTTRIAVKFLFLAFLFNSETLLIRLWCRWEKDYILGFYRPQNFLWPPRISMTTHYVIILQWLIFFTTDTFKNWLVQKISMYSPSWNRTSFKYFLH